MKFSINNFMRDNVLLRGLLYFAIAAIPAFITDISQFKSFSEISQVSLVVIISNFILQGIIAVRAFIDQSISRTAERRKKVDTIETDTK